MDDELAQILVDQARALGFQVTCGRLQWTTGSQLRAHGGGSCSVDVLVRSASSQPVLLVAWHDCGRTGDPAFVDRFRDFLTQQL